MNDSQEPSYYEIALTNRQVLVFFVVLLLCVVGAFFSGVWLGQQRADGLPMVAEAPVEEAPEQTTEQLAELNFFTDDPPAVSTAAERAEEPKPEKAPPKQQAKPSKVAPSGNPGTTLLEDLNGDSAATEAEPRSEPVAEKAPPPRRDPESTTVPATSRTSAPAGGYVIQVFSSTDGTQAGKLRDRLAEGGYQAFISPVDVDGRTMHRVRVGPFPDKGEADAVAGRVGQAYKLDTWVTRNE